MSMDECRDEWNKSYGQMEMTDALLDMDKRSPENFIDEIKMEYLEPHLPYVGTFVEIGAGSGRLITRIGIKRPKCKLVGIDYSHYSTVAIKENFWLHESDGSCICSDAFHIPLKDGSCDVVISGGLVEHFNEKEVSVVIQEMTRILKYDGLFYADIAPKKFSMLRPVILKEAGGYENSFTQKQWKKILEENGVVNINIFSGLILPPNFYNFFKKGIGLNIMYMLKPLITWTIGNVFSDVFGFEYFVFGRKE